MNTLTLYLAERGCQSNALTRSLSKGDTPREILQQPWTWRTTAAQLSQEGAAIEAALFGKAPDTILLCGAGTSDYAGRSVQEALRLRRKVFAVACPTTDFILRPRALFPPAGEVRMVHFARSGESPESVETLRIGLDVFGERSRHWVVTCNAEGKLAHMAREHPEACTLTLLHPATNDRGLAMTSSYSNMTLAGLWLADPGLFPSLAERLVCAAERLLEAYADTLAEVASQPIERAFYLGNGALEAAAIESALKMQELTRGIVITKSETFLGFRHGPISALTPASLLVGFFSSESHVRQYEEDLASQRSLGLRLFVCDEATPTLRSNADILVEIPEWQEIPDAYKVPVAVVVGQLLALFRALALGVNPDDPAGPGGAYSRVVQGVMIHPYSE